jgi:hypothetical protein
MTRVGRKRPQRGNSASFTLVDLGIKLLWGTWKNISLPMHFQMDKECKEINKTQHN